MEDPFLFCERPSGQGNALYKIHDITDGGQLGQARNIDHIAAVVFHGGKDCIIGLDVAAHGGDGGPLDLDLDLARADDAVGALQVGFRLADVILVGRGVSPLEQHDLIVRVVAVGAGGQLEGVAEGVVLGHLAHGPDGAFVVQHDAIVGGVVGVGGCRGAAVDDQRQHKVSQRTDQHDHAHGEQQPGCPLLGRVLRVNVLRHGIVSFLQYQI